MSVSDGMKANQVNFNQAFLSRINDSDTIAKIDLNNQTQDPASGTDIVNVQRELNGLNSLLNDTPQVNQPADRKPTWASNLIGSPNQAVKERIDSVQAVVEAQTVDIDEIRQTTGTIDGDTNMGAYTPGANGFSITDDESTKTNIQELVDGVDSRIALTEKGQPNGVATLDGSGLVPASQLPSFVDDVLEFADLASFPATGETGKIYVALDTNLTYRWSGSAYIEIAANQVASVNGQTGVVVLDTDDVAEGATNLYFTDTRADARISASSIDALSDVDTTTTPPVIDQALVWDGTNWIPQDQSGSGGGGGAAGRLFFTDRLTEDIANVAPYNDASGAVPLDGVGGTATVLTALDTVSPITGLSSYELEKGAGDKLGEGWAILTDVPLDLPAKEGEPITVQFRYQTDANYASGDVRMFYYLLGDNQLFSLNGIDGQAVFGNSLNKNDQGSGQFTSSLNATSATTGIRLIAHIATSNALNYKIKLDEVTIGTASQLVAPIVTDWIPYTPSAFNLGSISSNVARYRRVGDSMEIFAELIFSTGGSSGTAAISLPAGFTANLSVIPIARQIGTAPYFIPPNEQIGSAFLESATTIAIMPQTGGSYLQGTPFVSGSYFRVLAKIPIQQWANSSNIVSSTQAAFKAGGIRARKTTPQSIPNLVWTTVTNWSKDRDDLGEFDASTGIWTASKDGWFHFVFSQSFASTSGVGQRIVALWVNDTVDRIAYGEVPTSPTFATNCECSISAYLKKGDQVYPKVLQTSGGNLSTNGNGATDYFSAVAIPDLSVVGLAGQRRERLEVSSAAATQTTTIDSWTDAGGFSLPLTPGVWNIGYDVTLRLFTSTASAFASGNVAIFDASNTLVSNTIGLAFKPDNAVNHIDQVSRSTRITVTQTTTYKLRIRNDSSLPNFAQIFAGNWSGNLTDPDTESVFWAERIP